MDNYNSLLEEAIKTPGKHNLSEVAPVIAMFLTPFRPIVPPTENGDNMTSVEIVMALQDTCTVSINDVTDVMLYLGYRLHQNSLKGLEWSMSHPKIEG